MGQVPRYATALHKTVITRLGNKLSATLQEIPWCEVPLPFDRAFNKLCKPGKGVKYPSLRADDLDVLPEVGGIVPRPSLSV